MKYSWFFTIKTEFFVNSEKGFPEYKCIYFKSVFVTSRQPFLHKKFKLFKYKFQLLQNYLFQTLNRLILKNFNMYNFKQCTKDQCILNESFIITRKMHVQTNNAAIKLNLCAKQKQTVN